MKYFRLGCLFCFGWYGSLQTIQADPIGELLYTFTTINVPGSTSTSAYGLNDSGQIVGAYTDSTGAQHGFLDTNGTFTTLPFVPTGINNVGQIVGISPNGFFLDTNGTITDIAVPGSVSASINPSNLMRINDLGQIVGNFYDRQLGYRAFVYSNGVFEFLPTGFEVSIFADKINNAGQIVTTRTGADVGTWLYENGQYIPIFTSAQGFNVAYGVSLNNVGQVLGTNPPGAFVYTNGVIGGFSFAPSAAYDINGAGVVVGGNLLATPVPEPASLLLFTAGLLGLGAAFQRKHRA